MKRMMSTEWKDQRAKCEGDAVLIGHINKCSEILLPQSHIDTLAQVQALVDERESQGHAPQGASPVLKEKHTGPRPTRSEPSPA